MSCFGRYQPCKPGAGCSSCKSWGSTFAEINNTMAKPETWVMIRSRQLDDIEYDLLQAKHAYYCVGKPEMTDAQYDRLEDVLRRERPDSPVLSTVGCGLCYKSS